MSRRNGNNLTCIAIGPLESPTGLTGDPIHEVGLCSIACLYGGEGLIRFCCKATIRAFKTLLEVNNRS
jgi:hypothetical protein